MDCDPRLFQDHLLANESTCLENINLLSIGLAREPADRDKNRLVDHNALKLEAISFHSMTILMNMNININEY